MQDVYLSHSPGSCRLYLLDLYGWNKVQEWRFNPLADLTNHTKAVKLIALLRLILQRRRYASRREGWKPKYPWVSTTWFFTENPKGSEESKRARRRRESMNRKRVICEIGGLLQMNIFNNFYANSRDVNHQSSFDRRHIRKKQYHADINSKVETTL